MGPCIAGIGLFSRNSPKQLKSRRFGCFKTKMDSLKQRIWAQIVLKWDFSETTARIGCFKAEMSSNPKTAENKAKNSCFRAHFSNTSDLGLKWLFLSSFYEGQLQHLQNCSF